jgi:uncharacterized protein (TIGR03437 family)
MVLKASGCEESLWFVSPTQINFQAPDDTATGGMNVVVTTPVGSIAATITLGQSGPSFSLYNGKYAAAIVGTPGKPGNSGSISDRQAVCPLPAAP